MQCEIRSMSEERKSGPGQEQQQPRVGFVNQVCREWLVHEDNALAHRLQEEEIEMHYQKNRSDRQVVREDFREARELQNEEDQEAQTIQQMYEQMLIDQEMSDAQVAMRLQELERQQNGKVRQGNEEADERFAWQLQEKEKQRFERKKKCNDGDKERKHFERVKIDPDDIFGEHYVSTEFGLPKSGSSSQMSSHDKTSSSSEGFEFSLKPTPDADEIENRRLREEQDAELARRLQEQESKNGYPDRDRLLAIEAQDRELAKLLQEQERAKVRRAKERAKLKALQRQMEQSKGGEEIEKKSSSGDLSVPRDNGNKPTRPSDLDIPRLNAGLNPGERETSRGSNKGRSAVGGSSNDVSLERRPPPPLPQSNPNSACSSNVNIAIAIDPTYNRRLKKNPIAVAPPSLVPAAETSRSNGSTPVLPSPVSVRTDTYEDDHCYDSDEGPAPPYMPIQGQKRMTSLEKKKKSKESCRHQ